MQKRLLSLVLLGLLLLPLGIQAQDQVTITLWDWYVSQSPAIDQAIEEFEAANPNINVERTVAANQEELIGLAFQSDSAPDVYMSPFTPGLGDQIIAGWPLAWNTFPDFEAFKATFPDPSAAFVEGVNVVDGNVYSAPLEAELPSLQLWVNTDLYKEAGLVDDNGDVVLPTTLEEVANNARAITEATGKYGFGLGNADGWLPIQFLLRLCARSGIAMSPNGFFFDYRTGKFESANSPCLKTLIQTMIDLKNEQVINPDFQSLSDENIKARFAEGEVAMIVGGSWLINGWKDTHPDFTAYTATGMPLVNEDIASAAWYKGVGGRFLSINANTPHPNEAWEFVKWIYSERFGEIWAETDNGVTIFTPGDLSEYAENDAMAFILASGDQIIPAPVPAVRNPDLSQVQTNLQGPTLPQIFTGLLTGQLTDIDAALADLDARQNAALEQGIADAAAAGADVSLEDLIFEDWDPTQPYITTAQNE